MNGLAKEVLKLPSLFEQYGYENNEPIHVHVAQGTPHGNSTKIWLTKSGRLYCC